MGPAPAAFPRDLARAWVFTAVPFGAAVLVGVVWRPYGPREKFLGSATVEAVLPLGFRFDVDAVLVDGVAHRSDCDYIRRASAAEALHVSAGSVHRAHRCPRECPRCRPEFETVLTHQLDPPVVVLSR